MNSCFLDCSKAFDMCRFDTLFQKLIDKGLPHVVIRVLSFVYQHQLGFVQLGGQKSNEFKLKNGTRQGSVLSPSLFTVYIDDMLKELRQAQLGCHIAGIWYGACAYADDLALLAPNREVLQKMITICEKYGETHNLSFSLDDDVRKSKSKCILFCGRAQNVKYPMPLKLYGKNLPWVLNADHLGHTLSQTVSMDRDCDRARATFISKSVDIRDQFKFAPPEEIIKIVELLCCDCHGSMIWDF